MSEKHLQQYNPGVDKVWASFAQRQERDQLSTKEKFGLPNGFVTEKGSVYSYNDDGSVHRSKYDGTGHDQGIAVFLPDDDDTTGNSLLLASHHQAQGGDGTRNTYIIEFEDNGGEIDFSKYHKVYNASDVTNPDMLAFVILRSDDGTFDRAAWVSLQPTQGTRVFEMSKLPDGRTSRHPGHKVSKVIGATESIKTESGQPSHERSPESERINQPTRLLEFVREDGPLRDNAFLFDDRTNDRISFAEQYKTGVKTLITPDKGVYLVATESGNQYTIDVKRRMIVNANQDNAYLMPLDKHPSESLPDIEFGKSWEIEGVFKTSPVRAVLAEAPSGTPGSPVPHEATYAKSPFVEAKETVRRKLNQAHNQGMHLHVP